MYTKTPRNNNGQWESNNDSGKYIAGGLIGAAAVAFFSWLFSADDE